MREVRIPKVSMTKNEFMGYDVNVEGREPMIFCPYTDSWERLVDYIAQGVHQATLKQVEEDLRELDTWRSPESKGPAQSA